MLDPGRYLAEAIYFLQYTVAQILWAINRALLAIAILAEGINTWITDNIAYFVGLLINALSAPLGGMFILALTALGCWYALSNLVQIEKWVEPSKLFTYGLLALFFFSSPILIVNQMESLRLSLNAGINQALLDDAAGDLFATGMNGTDVGLPASIPDTNSDGVIGSFDLVSAFMAVAHLDELDNHEFPVDYEATYFPFGDPSSINLSDEADRELAKSLASAGIERLLFALIAVPTAISEHLLRLALTGAAMLLYAGFPFALLFAFFVYTQAFLGAYLRQFINLLIETFLSVLIVAILIGFLTAAAQQGFGLYIGASVLVVFFIMWRIMSALRLASRALDLFGGSIITGGVGGMALAGMGQRAVSHAAGIAGAVATGGASLAMGGVMMGTATALRADARAGGAYLQTDPAKAEGRVRQLQTMAGYAFGRSETARHLIDTGHSVRSLARNFRDGETQDHMPDTLDYFRAGAAMSSFGSSPWLAMRLSPSLRTAYDQLGGVSGNREHPPTITRDADGAPVPSEPDTPPNEPTHHSADDDSTAADTPSTTSDSPSTPVDGANDDMLIPTQNGVPSHSTNNDPTTADTQPTRSAPQADTTILLETTSSERLAVLNAAVQQLGSDEPAQSAAAHAAFAKVAGTSHTDTLTDAIAQHAVETVQTAIAATAHLVDQYRHQSLNGAQILARFQSGQGTADLRAAQETPLSNAQLAAVADLTLLPRRKMHRADLVGTIAAHAAYPNSDATSIAASLGSPVGFGSQTGAVRGVLAGARVLQLTADDIAQLADQIGQGMRQQVLDSLTQHGLSQAQARELLSDIVALPDAITLPQTTASRGATS